MRFEELADGSDIFIDANIFIYHFTGASNECSLFLKRCEEGTVHGMTLISTLLEVLHRLMAIEAVKKGLVTPGNIAKKLKENPEVVKQLSEYYGQASKIEVMGIEVHGLMPEIIHASQLVRQNHGFMINDSLIVAFMSTNNISSLASEDKDFEWLSNVKVYKPSDI
jgi:predicted nucleic acid-binding protein